MAKVTGVVYDERRATQSYFEVLAKGKDLVEDESNWNVYKGEAKADAATEAAQVCPLGSAPMPPVSNQFARKEERKQPLIRITRFFELCRASKRATSRR